MKKILIAHLLVLLILSPSCGEYKSKETTESGPIKVEFKQTNGKYELYRDGKPYYIYGAGCEYGDVTSIATHGGNSFRTWSTENGRESGLEILNKAQANGLTVMMGLDLEKERNGFDYNNDSLVKKQFEYMKAEVIKYKDHPALLGWGLGNELNLDYTNKKVWDAVNDLAKMIHEVDGNHPATTMLAGINKNEVDYIKANCPDIDFLSIQMYGDVINLQQRIKDSGWDGAYIVSEWGATGHWEVGKTAWDAPIEQTSSEKADAIKNRWDKAIYSNKTHCLGSYVFLWGQKQERTPTWYGLFLESGEETEAIDVMHQAWTGKLPENRVPRLDSIFVNGKTRFENIKLRAGNNYYVEVFARDYDGDSLTITSEILPDIPEYYGTGGDYEKRPPTIHTTKSKGFSNKIAFKSPDKDGAYRVFIYVYDGNNNAATANVPFYVEK